MNLFNVITIDGHKIFSKIFSNKYVHLYTSYSVRKEI